MFFADFVSLRRVAVAQLAGKQSRWSVDVTCGHRRCGRERMYLPCTAKASVEQQAHSWRVLSGGSASWAVAGSKHWGRCAPLADDDDRHGSRITIAESRPEVLLAGKLRYI